jgi:hypothetical protein
MTNRNLSRPLTIITNGHSSHNPIDDLQDESFSIPEEEEHEEATPIPVMRKQKQWSIDASGVPHFLCILSKKNYLLFACDKYGCIDLYQLDGNDPSNAPRHLRQFDLFPGNSTNQKPQIIEAFTVYTPFIVVSARKKTDEKNFPFKTKNSI